MASAYHDGERAVQARAGVLAAAARLGGIVDAEIPPQAGRFLPAQRVAVVAAADARGRMWASLLTGDRGFVDAPDARTLHLGASPAAGDPLLAILAAARETGTPAEAGVLVIDLGTRRRLRVNGTARPGEDGGVRLHVREAYWNCPKYIQARAADPSPGAADPAAGEAPARAASLTDAQRAWIAAADTFFIGTRNPGGGADASHRGGEPGFVRLSRGAGGEDVLEFPDYPGNHMFNTLGNLAVDPSAGLLFVDFGSGATLQLTGEAEVQWEPAAFGAFPGAERAVRFRVAEAVELRHATALRWRLVERSPFNPPPPAPRPGRFP